MIPMLVGSRFRRTRTTPKRSKVWVGAVSSTLIQLPPSSASFVSLIAEDILEGQGKPTLARVRGSWNAWTDTSGGAATTSSQNVALGITVVSTKSMAAGIASLPHPITNIEWPWLWWASATVGREIVTLAGVTDITDTNRVIDGKAMRKIPPASTVILVAETGPALEASPDLNLAFVVRILLLPS